MTDILAVFRLEHADLALTATVAHDPSAVMRPIQDAGTDPDADRHLFTVTSDDFDRLEAGLDADPTVESYERVITLGEEAIYAFTYTDDTVLFSTAIGRLNGVILEFENEGTAWRLRVWFPDRASAQQLWQFATDHDVDVDLVRINDYASVVERQYGLTEPQREAILVALDLGYFDEPRGATLDAVAEELGIAKSSASRRLRRAVKRLAEGTVAETDR